jgi:hypothetical protein
MPAVSPVSAEPVVELIEVAPDWYVRIVDREGRETVNTFPMEAFAVVFAEQQCWLLSIVEFDRL